MTVVMIREVMEAQIVEHYTIQLQKWFILMTLITMIIRIRMMYESFEPQCLHSNC